MKEATLVYPHQLFKKSPALASGRLVYLIEEPLILTHNPIHLQKLILHKLSLDAYSALLTDAGYTVLQLSILEYKTTEEIFKRLKADGITTIHVVDTTDYYLEQALSSCGIPRVSYESPLFVLPKAEAQKRYIASKKHLAQFYKTLRKDRHILIDEDREPQGGKWSFDEENRNKLPRTIALPEDVVWIENDEVKEAVLWSEKVEAEKYGEARCWIPYTQEGAEAFLQDFLSTRFALFGTYEDAISISHTRLFHSTLSPLINIGLLTPQHVLDTALVYGKKHNVPLNSLEGFVRQIIGWREFIRASYECDGSTMRTQNFFKHTRKLPKSFWDASTGLPPLDLTISRALTYGYTHHIERLMVMGNFLLLCGTKPDDVYTWFMGMYVDAYDWVMVPNVYGMSQFADGGIFATKPYISGSNYLKKMSNYETGPWEETWTALYWNFIETHSDFFKKNHRLSMMPRLLEKMDPAKRALYTEKAAHYLQDL
jgi:deoxyribodipyrimidine photolyase-related protein